MNKFWVNEIKNGLWQSKMKIQMGEHLFVNIGNKTI